ncbi:MAG: hypothetical protein RLZ67_277 [Actinomycetota bacterium]
MLGETLPPQDVVGDPPPFASNPQEVVRLQHCSYTFVNDPRKILFCSAAAARTTRSETARSQVRNELLPPHPMARGRYRLPREPTATPLWIGSGHPCELKFFSGETPCFSVDCVVGYMWRSTPVLGTTEPSQTAWRVTGMAFNTALPDKGSISLSSVRMFEFTPALAAATAIWVPGTP